MFEVRGSFISMFFVVLLLPISAVIPQTNSDDYDHDYELIDNSAPVREDGLIPQEDSPAFETDTALNVAEISSSQCLTRERTRVCDCGFQDEPLAVPKFSGNMLQITIRNCKQLLVRASTFANVFNIATLQFENIGDLVLHSSSLNFPIADWGHVNIHLRNVRVDLIPSHTISGFIQSITIENSALGYFERFAVNGIRSTVQLLQIRDTILNGSEPYAFKKFTADLIEFNNVTMSRAIPSKFFYGIVVRKQFSIRNCNFQLIQPSSFDMQDVDSFQLVENDILTISGEAFRMQLLNGVTIQGNRVENCHTAAFRALTIQTRYWQHHTTPMQLQLKRNTIGTMEIISPLIISADFHVNIMNLRYSNRLICDDIHRLRQMSFFELNRDSIEFQMADKLLNSDAATNESDFHSLSFIFSHFCIKHNFFWYYILFGGSLLLILFIVIIITFCVWYRRRKAEMMSLIMPDGRTYRETTIVMQIENHNLLKTDL